MNRTILFDSPFLLGFEHTRNLIERAAKAAAEGYPPYNVEDAGDGRVRISLAVAGFTPDQLAVTLEDNQLTVTGKRDPEGSEAADRAYLHRGIAARGFVRIVHPDAAALGIPHDLVVHRARGGSKGQNSIVEMFRAIRLG